MLKRRPYDSLNVEFNDYNPYRTAGEFKPREDWDVIVADRARPDEIELVFHNPRPGSSTNPADMHSSWIGSITEEGVLPKHVGAGVAKFSFSDVPRPSNAVIRQLKSPTSEVGNVEPVVPAKDATFDDLSPAEKRILVLQDMLMSGNGLAESTKTDRQMENRIDLYRATSRYYDANTNQMIVRSRAEWDQMIADAEAYVKNADPNSARVNQITQQLRDLQRDQETQKTLVDGLDFSVGYLGGILEGFFIDGLWGTVEGIGMLAWEGGKLVYWNSPVGVVHDYLYVFGKNQFTGSDDAYKHERMANTAQWFKEIGEQYGPYALALAIDFSKIDDAVFATLYDGLMKGAYDFSDPNSAVVSLTGAGMQSFATWYAGASDETKLVFQIAEPLVRELTELIQSTLADMPYEQAGRITGRLLGMVLFEVAFAVGTSGVGTAIKAGGMSKLLYKLQEIPGLSLIDEGGRVTKLLAKFADNLAFLTKTEVCFVAGTKVHTKDGLKNIEAINPGDLVLTRFEEAGWQDTVAIYRPVLQLITTHPDTLYHVTLETDQGARETIATTAVHPFYVIEKSAFILARELKTADSLVIPNGHHATVVKIEVEHAPPGMTLTTYNFAVAETHTYFVGVSGVWVHNTSPLSCKQAFNKARQMLDDPNTSVDDVVRGVQEFITQTAKTDPSLRGSEARHARDALNLLIKELRKDPDSVKHFGSKLNELESILNRRIRTTEEMADLGRLLKNGEVSEEFLRKHLHPDDVAKLLQKLEKRLQNRVHGIHDKNKVMDVIRKTEDKLEHLQELATRTHNADELAEINEEIAKLRVTLEEMQKTHDLLRRLERDF